LNLELRSTVPLLEDGIFGPHTSHAVAQFHLRHGIAVNGMVDGPTWRALGVTIDINHRVTLFAQPAHMTCWSAAATMLQGSQSVHPAAVALAPSGGLCTHGGNVQAFAHLHDLQMHAPRSWTVQALARLLSLNGPLWVGGRLPNLRAVVIGAMWGNGRPNGSGTALLMYDPLPPNAGRVQVEHYQDWITHFPLATAHVLHR
jgi:hypothetical protein